MLAEKNIPSLRFDLRGHGENTNLGKFIPGNKEINSIIWNVKQDVIIATSYLKTYSGIDPNGICISGASCIGEETAEAGRLTGYAKA